MIYSLETVSIVASVMVILIETIILYRLYHHSRLIEKQFKKEDEHIRKLEEFVSELNIHSKRIDKTTSNVLKDVEKIYRRVCQPPSEDDESKSNE
jgi:CII-binding regulator of phage lambda lysogenization HflD